MPPSPISIAISQQKWQSRSANEGIEEGRNAHDPSSFLDPPHIDDVTTTHARTGLPSHPHAEECEC